MELWEFIPNLTLLEIMKYLCRRDRLACGVVCKEWYTTMCNPLLWKKFVVCLDTDLTDPLTMVIARRYAHHITSIDLAWSRPFLPRRWIKNRITSVAQDTYHFLIFLKECNINLTSFKLTDWYFTWKYKKVIFHLTTFLKQQRQLRYVNLSNAYLNKSEILKILFACRHSDMSVKYLELLGAFHEWHNVFMNSGFANALQQFKNLETLKIDYSSVSDRILTAFISNGNTSLKCIEISVKDVDSRSHVISSDVWSKILKNCKNLNVILRIYNICHYEDIYYILVQSMPLQRFVLNCGYVWDQSRSRNYCGMLNLLMNNFEKTLTHITLQLRNNREMIDLHLHEIIKQCKLLRCLEFDGVLRNLHLLSDICCLQYERKTEFKYLHVRPRSLNVNNNIIISYLWTTNVKHLLQQDFHFEVESINNPVVRIFC